MAPRGRVSKNYKQEPTPEVSTRDNSTFTARHSASSGTTVPDTNPEIDNMATKQDHVDRMVVDEGYQTGEASTQRPATANNNPQSFIGAQKVGRGTEELLGAIKKLETLGIETSVLPLPKIVVVGDQSAGKSSLIEAVSEIKVPRNAGTCTRCPFQINLTKTSNAESWRCDVTLVRSYIFEKYDSSLDASLRSDPYYPWHIQDPPTIVPFATVKRKEDLEEVIYRAQLATINPEQRPEHFLSCELRKNVNLPRQVEFSPNIVRLDLSGPDLPHLSFYDLPGVINQTEDSRNGWLVKLVKNLIGDYIRPENSLVLLACSMESDIAISNASGIVRELKAENRCIGVLTKPDRIAPGEPTDTLQAMLRNKKYPLGHAYYVTKQPSQKRLDEGITHAQARREEYEFFNQAAPWADELAEFRDRFGTARLQDALSEKLTLQIRESLPIIEDQISTKLDEVERELETIPEPPQNAVRVIVDSITAFTNDVKKHMEGVYPNNQFKKEFRDIGQAFRNRVADMKPILVLVTRTDADDLRRTVPALSTPAKPSSIQHPINLINLDDSDTESVAATPTPASRKRKVPNGSVDSTQTPAPQRRCNGLGRTPRREEWHWQLEFIRDTLNTVCTSDIPNSVDPTAVDHLILKSLDKWHEPVEEVVEYTLTALSKCVFAVLDQHLAAWQSTEFYSKTHQLVSEFINKHMSVLEASTMETLKLERFKPATLQDEHMTIFEKQAQQVFEAGRYKARAKTYFKELDKRTGKETPSSEIEKRMAQEAFRRELGPDPYAREVAVMAQVRGYYTIASLRLVDRVYQAAQLKVFEEVRQGLHDTLVTELGVYNPDSAETCAQLLAEDKEREARRAMLKRKRQQLTEAKETLAQLAVVPA